jgi:hypothetical protein
MTDFLAIDAIVNGIINAETPTKQELGRRFAAYLGIQAGLKGKDEGVDGSGEFNGRKIYFQSKLESSLFDASRAAEFYGNLCIHGAQIGIMLSGKGYTSGFRTRLNKDPELNQKFKIHLLSLSDIFAETPDFEAATLDLPGLQSLCNGNWKTLIP